MQVDVQNAEQAGVLNEALDALQQDDLYAYGLGAIEATMSKFIPDSLLDEAIVAIPPTLEIRTGMSYNTPRSEWSLDYNIMASPHLPTSNEHYVRIMYMTKNGNTMAMGDGNNACLLPETSDEDCMLTLKNNYIVSSTLDADSMRPDSDHLTFDEGGIVSTHTIPAADAASNVQQLKVEIEHARIVGTKSGVSGVSNKQTSTDSSGNTLEIYQFGIGVIFWPKVGSRTIIFDKFDLVKNSMGSWTVEKSHQYTIVRHVQLQIVQPAADKIAGLGNNRLIKLETMIEAGHELDSIDPIKISIRNGQLDSDFIEITGIFSNGNSLQAGTDCASFKTEYDIANVDNCLSSIELCEIQENDFTTQDSASVTKLISVNVPLLSSLNAYDDFFDVQTTFKTTKGGVTLYSILNFKIFHTSITPKCNAVVRQAFSPIDYIEVKVYGKMDEEELELYETCTGGDCAMTNMNIQTLSAIQALNTIFLGLRDDPSASADAITFQRSLLYMQSSSDEIYLDDLYISHKLNEDTYTFVDSDVRVNIDSTGSATGRSRISLQTQLTAACPEETSATSTDETCITTHDYLHGTVLPRPLSPSHTYVYERKFLGSSLFSVSDLSQGQSVTVSDFIPYYIYIPDTCDDISTMTCGNYELEGVPRRVSGSSDWKQCYFQFTNNVDLTVTCSATQYTISVIINNAAANDDHNFLKTIYGSNVNALTFMETVVKVQEDPRYVKSFWVSPIYHWPANPIGLNDITAIHMSWSIGNYGGISSSSSRRRLLSNINADIMNKTLNSSFGIETSSEFNPIISTIQHVSTPQPYPTQITEVYDYQEDYVHSMAIEEDIALACKKVPDYRNFPYSSLKEQINPASICVFEDEVICKDLLEIDTSLKLETLLMIIEKSKNKNMLDIAVSNNTNKMCKKVTGNSAILQLEFYKIVPSPINLWIQYLNGTEVCNLQYLVDLYKEDYSLVQVENNVATFLSKNILQEYNIQDVKPECFDIERKNINLLYLYEQASHFLLSYAVFSWIRHDLVKESMRLRVGCNNEFTSFQFMHGNSHKLIKR